jgi:outer membrane protein assembly factor BamB
VGAGLFVVLTSLVFGCSFLHENGLFLQPERDVLPEYPGKAAQHRVLSVLWRVPLIEVDSEPVNHHHHGRAAVSSDGRWVFVGSHDGAFYCINAKTGKVHWRKLVEGPFDSQPLIRDGVVYAGSGGGMVYAWRQSDGESLWTHKISAALDAQPVMSGDRLLLASDANTLTCLDAMTGDWKWAYRRDVPSGRFQIKGVAKPLVVEGIIYMGFSDGYLAKLAIEDGAVLAVRKLVDRGDRFTDVDTDPLKVSDDTLLVGPFSKGLVALNSADLSERWVHETKGPSSMAIKDDLVYYSTADSRIEALHLSSSKLAWRFNAQKGALSRPVLAGDWLLISSSEHSLLVLDRTDGRLLQVFNPGKGSGSAPIVKAGKVYWVSNGQTLYCMALVR